MARADSGIYLRGCPQIQIWDYTDPAKFSLGADKGSGGLWNNLVGAAGKDPLVKADRPFGEWNHFRIVMVGARVTVWLNEQLVVDHARLENYYDRSKPIPARGPIELQTHGGEIRWRNIFIREIGATGARASYAIIDGAIVCRPQQGGVIHTTEEFSDFVARLEFKLPPGGNNGLALRYAGTGDAAYTGWCESQVLDDHYEQVTGEKIDPRQAHGSAYGMIAAARGYQRPAGEWNFEEVTVRGSTLKVELNGTLILEGDLALVKESLADRLHPGRTRTSGSFGFAGHNDPVAFRAIRLLRL